MTGAGYSQSALVAPMVYFGSKSAQTRACASPMAFVEAAETPDPLAMLGQSATAKRTVSITVATCLAL